MIRSDRDFILIGDSILAEVLQGFDEDADFRRARALLDCLDCVEMTSCALALSNARNNRLLRRLGIAVRKSIDVGSPRFASSTATCFSRSTTTSI
jgi:hypothetical protein